MKDSELEDLLCRWGRVYGEAAMRAADVEEHGEVYASGMVGRAMHPLAVAMEYAPGKKERAVGVAYRRSVRVGEKAWSRDPVTCTESRHYGGALYFAGAEIHRVEPLVSLVEKAAMDLYRINTLHGLILRGEYCRRGKQIEQVEWINGVGRGIRTTLRNYRQELPKAKAFILGRVA